MPRPCWLLLLLLGLAYGPMLRADDPPQAQALDSRLTLERVFGGPPVTAPLPDWSWRPGHSQLVRVVTREKRDLLLAHDPTSGAETTLLDLTEFEALVPGAAGAGERGLGRGGPARLLWTEDGRALCALVKGERVWVDLAGPARRRLTAGGAKRSDVQVAPGGGHISYEADGHLWAVPTVEGPPAIVLRGGDPDVLRGTLDWLYPEELGIEHASWWSPDGKHLVVLELDEREVPRYPVPDSLDPATPSESMRYPYAGQTNPKAALLVVSVAGAVERAPVRLDLGTPAPEYVARVAWMPDAARIVVLTLDRAQRTLVARSCDPATGAGTTLFTQQDRAWIDPPPTPRFLAPREMLCRRNSIGAEVWTWAHLDPAGTAVVDGIQDETPVDLVAHDLLHAHMGRPPGPLGAGLGEILVEGAVPGERRRGLWGRNVGRLTEVLAEGRDSLDVALDATSSWALVRRSTTATPTVLELRRVADGALVRTLGDARTPAYDALDLPAVEEGETDLGEGARALWRLFKPRQIAPGTRLPMILSVYGGPGSRTVEDRFGGGATWTALLVQRGFAVLQVDGRGTGGQGPAHERLLRGRLADVDWAGLPQAIADVARARPWIDPARVGIWGWSYGGSLACDALTRRPDVFRCGVAVAPVTDWRLYDTIYTERYMGLPDQEKAAYDATSSVERAKTAAFKGCPCRLLLLHGLADDNVHPVNTLRLVEALLAAEKTEFSWHLYANRGHGLGGAGRDVHRRALEWFERHLKSP